jgi:hypothetical protein
MRLLSLGLAVSLSIVVMSCGGDNGSGDGPVAAHEAHIEITYSDDGTSFTGDREITEGTINVTFVNEADSEASLAVYWL